MPLGVPATSRERLGTGARNPGGIRRGNVELRSGISVPRSPPTSGRNSRACVWAGREGVGLAGRGRGLSVPTGSWSVLDHAELRANTTVCLVLLSHHIKALLIAFVN